MPISNYNEVTSHDAEQGRMKATAANSQNLANETLDPNADRKVQASDGLRIVAVAGLFVAAAYAMNNTWVRAELFDIERLRTHFQNHDFRTYLIFLIAATALNAMGVPRVWISTVAGTLFGAFVGSGVALVASLSGSSLNFLIARYLFKTQLVRLLPAKARKWMNAFNRHGFRLTLYLRLFPFANATVTNLVCGASSIRYKTFILATTLGFMPLTIVLATLGSSAAKASHWQMIIGLLLFVLLMTVQRLFKQFTPAFDNSTQDKEHCDALSDFNAGHHVPSGLHLDGAGSANLITMEPTKG